MNQPDIDELAATLHEEDCPVENNPRLVSRFKAKSEIAAAGIRDEDLIQELAEVGFDGDTIRVLNFIPLMDVAWADGEIQPAEREAIETVLRERHIEEGSAAHRLVASWLEHKPCDALYTRGRALIAMIMHDARHHEDDVEWILKASRDIAVASTNIYAQLGLASSSSDEEARVIRRIAHRFGYHGSS